MIEDGEIVSISEPTTSHCPLRSGLYDIPSETTDSVRRSVEFYIKEWGMFTPRRIVRTKLLPVSFGVSEILASGLAHSIVDAVVLVCEGAGTVISDEPDIVQGIGAHMTGLIETSPEKEIVQKLRDNGVRVPFPEEARIDQLEGYRLARSLGYERVGITVTGLAPEVPESIRTQSAGSACAILCVHNTGVSRRQAESLSQNCDIVTSCASRWTREVIGPRAIMQLGLRIPVFVMTALGKQLALARLEDFTEPLIVGTGTIPRMDAEQPYPLR